MPLCYTSEDLEKKLKKHLLLRFRVLQLSHGQKEDAGAPEFAQVFTVFWFGVIAVSINAKLLGGAL